MPAAATPHAFSLGVNHAVHPTLTRLLGYCAHQDGVFRPDICFGEPCLMLRKIMFAALAAATTLTALPASADAQGYYRGNRDRDGYRGERYRDGDRDRDGYRGERYRTHRRYHRGDYYGYYGRPRTVTRVYVGGPGYYPGYYGRGYYDSPRYYRSSYYGGRGYYRCDDGATGTIVGAGAGALIGREIGRDGRRYRYRGRNSGTTGAIIGGALGALVGREATRC
jgi:Glycine zipper 2TM domain